MSSDIYVNVMEQYHPDAHVGKPERPSRVKEPGGVIDGSRGASRRYQEINRAASEGEISIVRKAAEGSGIWRFCDPPRHDGFSL